MTSQPGGSTINSPSRTHPASIISTWAPSCLQTSFLNLAFVILNFLIKTFQNFFKKLCKFKYYHFFLLFNNFFSNTQDYNFIFYQKLLNLPHLNLGSSLWTVFLKILISVSRHCLLSFVVSSSNNGKELGPPDAIFFLQNKMK